MSALVGCLLKPFDCFSVILGDPRAPITTNSKRGLGFSTALGESLAEPFDRLMIILLDTLADTALSRFLAVTIGERVPGGPPPGVHDPALFVNRVHHCPVSSFSPLRSRLV